MIQFQIHRLLAEVRAGERRVRKIMTMMIVTIMVTKKIILYL